MTKIDSKFVVDLQGKEFVTYEGLLDVAHQKGLIAIKTELVELNENGRCIMKATAITETGHFEGYGDADPSNVNRMIGKHIIRMAETRAKARALRDLTNIGMTAIEELGGDDNNGNNLSQKPSQPKPKQQPKQQQSAGKCTSCDVDIKPAVKAYSEKNHGKPLCRDCQQLEKGVG